MQGILKVWEYKEFLLKGTIITIEMAFGAAIIGFILGTIAGMARLSKNPIINGISSIYVTIIRGTPMLLQIIFIYVAVPQLFKGITGNSISPDPVLSGIIGIGINSGAYMAEIVRAGIQSIDKGQMEAARSLGLSNAQAMRYIILPQAFYRVVPAFGNELIVLLKDTSLVSAIGARELMNSARILGAKFYQYAQFLIGAGLIYLSLTFIISKLVAFVERRFGIND
ncbi:amino acid ABC transporter permease [Maledivibacter halophilus]|uniref:Amino acid ABC transporter membrane protein, PAAT family (TC 3.A.1.3.-) n=1 Tax=Maledivibacter halophilus TaxID=36842 RepID=A0A1T5LL35_9FIRM|nr:amino acid ABC transporter permease [Maledivibacter halophilus]SKC76309.1 amino acid ABC transporter membrane protein, PAAT family (TC 3.A.1.3.-) [Maledivibacter halophilus]